MMYSRIAKIDTQLLSILNNKGETQRNITKQPKSHQACENSWGTRLQWEAVHPSGAVHNTHAPSDFSF